MIDLSLNFTWLKLWKSNLGETCRMKLLYELCWVNISPQFSATAGGFFDLLSSVMQILLNELS